MSFAQSLKQLLWKSHQLIALQLQISEFPETVEEAIGQRGDPVATQVQLQQAPLEVMIVVIIKHICIKIGQLILLQVQLFQTTQPPEVSGVKSLEPVAFQLQAANREIATKKQCRKR